MKRLLLLPALLAAFCSQARDIEVHRFDTPVKSLLYHLRLERHADRANKATLYWNFEDSANHIRATFDIPPQEVHADYGSPVRLTVTRRCGGEDSLLLSGKTVIKGYDGMSAIISLHSDGAASLTLGGDKASEAFAVPFCSEHPAALLYATDFPAKELDNFLLVERRESAAFHQGGTDALIEAVKASSDRAVGFWTYLDRNSDPAQTAVSRRYVLATVPSGDGTYDIVYVDGDAPGWKPGRIKGRLKKTVFTDHYDLEWTTVDGTLLVDDTSATLEGASNILRLDFPLLRTSVRFRKERLD